MNRIIPSAVLFLSLLMVGCGKEASEKGSPTSPQTGDTTRPVDTASLVAQRITGIWNYTGADSTIGAKVHVLSNGTAIDTAEVRRQANGDWEIAQYIVQRSWRVTSTHVIFTKTSCQRCDEFFTCNVTSCPEPLSDSASFASILSSQPLTFSGALGELSFKH